MKFPMESPAAIKLTLAVLLIAHPAANLFAKSTHQPKDYKDMAIISAKEVSGFAGWSAGVGLGVMTSAANTSTTSVSQAADSPFFSGTDGNQFSLYARSFVYKFGPMGNLFAGYGYMNDIYYAGVNLGVNILGANQLKVNQAANVADIITNSGPILSLDSYTNTMLTETKYTRGWAEPFLDIKLGGLITPETLAYGIIGTSYNSLSIKSSTSYRSNGSVDIFFGAPPVPPAVATLTTHSTSGYSATKNFFGLRIGAGMEVLLTPHCGVAADYIYSFYPTYKNTTTAASTNVACDASSGCLPVASVVVNTTKITLSDQQVMAKFIYHIG